MPRKKQKQPAQRPGPMRWEFKQDIPTSDFFGGMTLDDTWGLQEAVGWKREDLMSESSRLFSGISAVLGKEAIRSR